MDEEKPLSLLSRLFGKRGDNRKEKAISRAIETNDDRSRRESLNDVDLDSIEYIPLPPAPHTWEVDGRDEYQHEYEDPQLKNIYKAGFQRKNTKVINLAADLSPEQLSGRVGETVAIAYRDIVKKRLKANQIKPAACWAKKMLETVPDHCTDADKRSYNNILSKLDKANVKHSFSPIEVPQAKNEPLFQFLGGLNWNLDKIKNLSKDERPDTNFHLMAFTIDGALYKDRTGKGKLSTSSPEMLRKLDRNGKFLAECALSHDTYRVGWGLKSAFCVIMDRYGGLHIYDRSLTLVFERDLKNDRRVMDHFRTTETNYWGEIRSQIRAVDVNSDGTAYLFSLADEAWCCSVYGETVWGLRMPLNEGWVRAVRRCNRTGPSAEVESALKTLGLALPVSPNDIKSRFRVLAQRHHPDRNPGDLSAHRLMQEINEAFQILTGVDPSMIDIEVEESEVTYFRRETPNHIFEAGPFRFEICLGGGQPQDWIYGASFSVDGTGAFLATYSGKIVEVDGSGTPIRVYDLGSVPNEIIDTGDYLYFLTPTRLYVLDDRDRLVTLIDVFRQGRLLVTTTGFGLLDNKCFQWFEPSGNKIGEIITRDPIRALFDSNDGAILETRQHRAIVGGLQLF
jgi:hypothetical protein